MRPIETFLDPSRKLVDAVVDWLCARLETDGAGALSLESTLVVVPTAQAGRTLRLQLAKRVAERYAGAGVLPPQVVQPIALVAPEDGDLATAGPVQLRAAFLKFVATRPRRHAEAGRTVLDEWPHLFHPDYIADVTSHLSFFDQLADIWRILAARGFLMADVAQHPAAQQVLAEAIGSEQARWEELGVFETAFFTHLHELGLCHEAEAIHAAKTRAKALPATVRRVVLPALVDPLPVLYDVLRQQRDTLTVDVLVHAAEADAARFDAWGRPDAAAWTDASAPSGAFIRDEDVIRAGSDTELARRIAADFPDETSPLARPSLGLCDAKLFPELAAAFLNRGTELYNPERHALAVSSLGHLVGFLIAIHAADAAAVPWEAFVGLLRLDDVLTAVLRRFRRVSAEDEGLSRSDVLTGLDVCQNTFLPHAVPADACFDPSRLQTFERKPFAAFQAAARTLLAVLREARAAAPALPGFVRTVLRDIYAHRRLDDGAKEFRAAAERVQELLTQLEDPLVGRLELAPGALTGLARKTLAEASYSLDPDSPHALKTEGWLELAWSPADKIALAGFNEGAVPDAVVGHAFLPDALREALDLTSNRRRLARDRCLLADLLAARAGEPGSVRAYCSLTDNAGNIHRPSRLLFAVPPERFARRVQVLSAGLPPENPTPPRVLADAWRARLPADVPMYRTSKAFPNGRLSASAIDTWLKCPFSYLLRYGVGMNRIVEKTELQANDFGTLVHRALEIYAREQLARTARGLAQYRAEGDIAEAFDRIMRDLRATYGADASVNLRLQLDAAWNRLRAFARIQARWAEEGWAIRAEPEYGFTVRPFAGEDGCDVAIKGSVDRIDWKDGEGYRLIDYKTWDSRRGAAGRILKGGEEQCAHARRLRLPRVALGKKEARFLTVQLPLYGRCLEVADPAAFSGKIADYCYVLLGATAEDVVVLGSADDQGPFEAVQKGKVKLADHVGCALETARAAIRRIAGNFFWPPGPAADWKYEFKDVLAVSPERDFPPGTPWRDAQEEKLRALEASGEVRA